MSSQQQPQRQPQLNEDEISSNNHIYTMLSSSTSLPLNNNANNQVSKTLFSPSSVTSIKIEKQENIEDEAETEYDRRRNRSTDTRLLIPVISIGNNSSEKQKSTPPLIPSSGSSIIDESRLLLKEYEQLRNDSVSEIQRAHDSLNAR